MKEEKVDEPINPMVFFIGGLALLVVVAALLILFRSKKTITPSRGVDEPKTVEELQAMKEEIERMTAIAKAKYHRRELDEESFREIVRDNQKRVIEIELKIKAFK
jgi:hypothetical protein